MKKYIISTLILVAGLSLVSCEDFLTRTPQSTLNPEAYFKTETDLKLFSNTFYNNLLDKEPFEEYSDLLTKNLLPAQLLGGNARTVPASGGGWSWGDLRKMNTLLANMDKCEDEAAKIEYTGVTKFFRAYFYYAKVKRFGDVPWIETELSSSDPALYAPRDSRELIMTHMIEDIDDAIAKLPANVSTYRVNKWAALALKARFCLFEGTYRKYHNINLEGHDYKYYLDLAAKAAKEVMDSGIYKLAPDYLTLFGEENADVNEYILAINSDFGLAIRHNANAFARVSSQGSPGLTKKFVDSFLMKDGSRFTDKEGWQTMGYIDETKDRDPRLAASCVLPGYTRIGSTEVIPADFGCSVTGFQIVKFVSDPTLGGGTVDRTGYSINDIPVLRLGEVYLNYAEALAENGTLTQNDLDISINLLRDRVGMPHMSLTEANANLDPYLSSEEYGYRNVTGSNAGVIIEIRRERTIELLQEGFRWDDLMRWKEGKCLEHAITGIYFPGPGEYDLTGDGKADILLYTGTKPNSSIKTMFKIGENPMILSEGDHGFMDPHPLSKEARSFDESRDYLFPIPSNERQLNPNLTQNPEWNDGLNF